MSNYWDDDYAEIAQSEGGEGGVIAECYVGAGYKTYSKGVTPVDDFFPFVGKAEMEKAKAKAKAFSEENGGKGAKFGIGIIAYKDGALSKGQPVTWKNDRVFFVDDFTEAAKKVVRPALTKLNIQPGKHWLRIGFAPDPYGTTETDQEGKEKIKQVAYPTAVFKSKAEALAAGAASNGDHGPDITPAIDKATVTRMKGKGKSALDIATFLASADAPEDVDPKFVKAVKEVYEAV